MSTSAVDAASASPESKHVTVRCQFCETWNRVDVARATDRPKCGKCDRPILIDRPMALDDESFARTVASSEVPVLVDFYADWCGPCKTMAPAVDAVAGKYHGRALVAKVDTERATRTAAQFQIRGIPTVIVFAGGHEAARQTGAVPLARLEQLLAAAL